MPVRPPALILHPAAPQLSSDGAGPSVDAPRGPLQANPSVVLAEMAALAQAVLAIITGVNLIRGTTSLNQLGSGVTLALSRDVAVRFGVGMLVVAVLVIGLTVAVARYSQWARALLALLELVALGASLAAFYGGGSVLGFVTVLAMGTGGSALIPFGAVAGIEAGLVYLLAIHPATYRAFSR